MEQYYIGPFGISPLKQGPATAEVKKPRRYIWEKPIGIKTFHGKECLRKSILTSSTHSLYERKP